MGDRVLASVRVIDSIEPIENADAVECAQIGGWSVVVQKGQYTAGMLATYVEIDSWVPTTVADFLTKGKTPRVYNGVPGERLKTMKIRGQISQGLLLPADPSWVVDQDVTDLLGITKWEAPVPAELAGLMKGMFPCFIPKTAQARIQNTAPRELTLFSTFKWEITEKLDGSSMTVYINSDNEFCVCSRNVELKPSDTNSFWKAARTQKLEEILRSTNASIAIQGELVGEGIQHNLYKTNGRVFYVFDIYDIKNARYYSPLERQAFVETHGLQHVPILERETTLTGEPIPKFSDTKPCREAILQKAEGKSVLCNTAEREGLVYKCIDKPAHHFKVISNRFLLKQKD